MKTISRILKALIITIAVAIMLSLVLIKPNSQILIAIALISTVLILFETVVMKCLLNHDTSNDSKTYSVLVIANAVIYLLSILSSFEILIYYIIGWLERT